MVTMGNYQFSIGVLDLIEHDNYITTKHIII